jgi:uncharacterized OB-fold protein
VSGVERVPIEPGYFTIPEDRDEPPMLLGSRCNACSETFYPRREVCASCLHRGTSDISMGPRGTLYTWTYLYAPLFNSQRAADGGYAVGQVDLPEGPRVQAVLKGGPDDFSIGMNMQLELETLRDDAEGREIVIYRFCPLPGEGTS